ncbi:ABC transporter ATP-binding protein [Oceanobacillus salinisoli]|uniref:ABC transporter ATP-binding protein n=1 Tax=Oceanobacillus salinisoli TaxID=2678611 RepID=UPI0018CC1DFF
MTNVLEIKDLSIDLIKNKERLHIVNNLNLTIMKKQKYGIVGESGSGKSLTSLSILNLLPEGIEVGNGHILLNNDTNLVNVSKKDMRHIRGNEISMIFQEPMTALDPLFTIEHQVSEVLKFHGETSKKEMHNKMMTLFEQVGFARPKQILKSYPHQLSGGMRQRVMIAMALICKPKLLIADEPTTALDVTIQAQILDLMNELTEYYDTSILLITHDLGVIAETCERVAVMYAGTVVEEASVKDLFDHPAHPYTKGLLSSVKSLGDRTKKLYAIPGNVPSPVELKDAGCRFASRCPFVMDICREKEPELFSVQDRHYSKCWLHDMEEGSTYEYATTDSESS